MEGSRNTVSISDKLLKKLVEEEYERVPVLFQQSVKTLRLQSVISVPQSISLLDLASLFRSENVRYGLVQTNKNSIEGIVSAETLNEVISEGDTMTASIEAVHLMEPKFSIVSYEAKVSELLEQAYQERYQYYVVTSEDRSDPLGLVSIRTLIARTIKALLDRGN